MEKQNKTRTVEELQPVGNGADEEQQQEVRNEQSSNQ